MRSILKLEFNISMIALRNLEEQQLVGFSEIPVLSAVFIPGNRSRLEGGWLVQVRNYAIGKCELQ